MSWRPRADVTCAVCGRRVLYRMTTWTPYHWGRVCAACLGATGPRRQTHRPAWFANRRSSTDA